MIFDRERVQILGFENVVEVVQALLTHRQWQSWEL